MAGSSTSGCNAFIRHRAAAQSGAYRWTFPGLPAFRNTQMTKSPLASTRTPSGERAKASDRKCPHIRNGFTSPSRKRGPRRMLQSSGPLIPASAGKTNKRLAFRNSLTARFTVRAHRVRPVERQSPRRSGTAPDKIATSRMAYTLAGLPMHRVDVYRIYDGALRCGLSGEDWPPHLPRDPASPATSKPVARLRTRGLQARPRT